MARHYAFKMGGGEYVDMEAMDRTVKMVIFGPAAGSVDRPEIVAALMGVCDVRDLSSVWKTNRGNLWFGTFANEEAAKLVVNSSVVCLSGDRTIRCMWMNRQELKLRVHWMPTFITDNFLRDVMSDFGKVRAVERETFSVGGVIVQTGVRMVKLVVTEKERKEVPHVLHFEGEQSLLIVCAGRSPVCLACGAEGHVRAYPGCPARVEKAKYSGKRSWADMTTGKSSAVVDCGDVGDGTGGTVGATSATGSDTGGAGGVSGATGDGAGGSPIAKSDDSGGGGGGDGDGAGGSPRATPSVLRAKTSGGDVVATTSDEVKTSGGAKDEVVATTSGGGEKTMADSDGSGGDESVTELTSSAVDSGGGGNSISDSGGVCGGAESSSWATAVEAEEDVSVTDSQIVKAADSVQMEYETEKCVKRKVSESESGSPRAENMDEKKKKKSESASDCSEGRKMARVLSGEDALQVWLFSGKEVEKRNNGRFRLYMDNNKMLDFIVCVCERTVLGDVRVISEKSVAILFTTDASSSEVLDELFQRFMEEVVVVCERNESLLRQFVSGRWKMLSRSCDVYVNNVRGTVFVMVVGKDDNRFYMVSVTKDMLQIQKDGGVKWTVKDETYGVRFESKAEARDWVNAVNASISD